MEASPLPARQVPQQSRWFMPTPGKFVALLLLSVALLYVSDQYDWFAFNKQKGWTVLIAVACVMAGLGLIVVWSAGAWLCGRRVQFGLLVLLLMVPAVAVPLAWLTREMQKARQLADTVTQIQQRGGRAFVSFSSGSTSGSKTSDVALCGETPLWLRRAFGEEFFGEVDAVFLTKGNRLSDVASLREVRSLLFMSGASVGDEELDAIIDLPHLDTVHIGNSEISDAGLQKLLKAAALKEVFISKSKVTRAGHDTFKAAFAGKCYVGRDLSADLERLRREILVDSDPNEVESQPKYDSPYTLEYRLPSSPALQALRRLFEAERELYRQELDEMRGSSRPSGGLPPGAGAESLAE